MTSLMFEGVQPQQEMRAVGEVTAEVSPVRRVAGAVLDVVSRAFSPLPETASVGMSEHFDHAEKRNDPHPSIDLRLAR